tara:strand:- start:88 stop:546 length:459 start_codon:yes stop_codon:yes gene_type:complete
LSYNNDGFKAGKRGDSVFSTNDTAGWVAGNEVRQLEKNFENPLQGEEHPNAIAIITLLVATAGFIALLLNHHLVPIFITDPIWRLVAVWLGSSAATYFILKALPAWLSGAVMALVLGGAAGYAGWTYLDPVWATGLSLGTGALMYLVYSTLE